MELRNMAGGKFKLLAALSVFCSVTSSQSWANEALENINFSDANLQNCINTVAAQNAWTHSNQFNVLNCAEKDIENLTGLEHFTELTELNLSLNQIESIAPLSSLQQLKVLYLGANNISDISAVEQMGELLELSVRSNNLSSIVPVSSLTKLQKLYIWGNQISDLSPVGELTELTHLWSQSNTIADVSQLQNNAKLEYADLRFNQLSDVTSFSQLRGLKGLDFTGNDSIYCSDLVALQNQLPDIDLTAPQLCVSDEISNVTFIDEKLQACVLQNASVNGWQQVSQVTRIQCAEQQVSDAFGINRFTNLQLLNLSINDIAKLDSIANLTNLEILYLGDNQISDISPLAELKNLTELSVRSNQLTDLSSLTSLTKLAKLYIWQNQIASLEPLAMLSELSHLWAANNQISDITPLIALPNLAYASLVDNEQISCSSLDNLEQRLGSELERPTQCVVTPIDEIQFADDALALCVADNVVQNGWTQVDQVEQLRCAGLGIANIEGIEHFTNLTFLDLSRNNVVDISALANLNLLTTLYLGDNQIADISPLANLTSLVELSLRTNNISDISALAGLTALNKLYIWQNSISDLSPLTNLSALTHLWSSANAISDISALAGLVNLVYLDLRFNQVADLTALSGLTQMTELLLADNQISDLSALADMSLLTSVNLQNNQISDISQLQPLTSLTDVQLQGNDTIECEALDELAGSLGNGAVKRPSDCISYLIADVDFADDRLRSCAIEMAEIAGWRNIDEMTHLSCAGFGITNIEGVEQFVNLTRLDMSRNQVRNLSPVAGLTALKLLYLGDNKITDISALSELTELTELSIRSNDIADLSAISKLTKMQKLYIWENNITSLEAISEFTQLTHLWASNNEVAERLDLSSFTQLQYLSLQATGISDLNFVSDLNLIELHVDNNQISNIDGLSGQTQLTQLNLANNQVSKVSALNNLNNLQRVDLSGNNNISCAELTILERNLGQNTVVRPQSCGEFSNTITKQYAIVDGKPLNAYIANHFTQSGETVLLTEPEAGHFSLENGILHFESNLLGTQTIEWARVNNNQLVEVLKLSIETIRQYVTDGYPSKDNSGQLGYGYSAYPGETISWHLNGAQTGQVSLPITNTAGEVFDRLQVNLSAQSIRNDEPWVNGFGYEKTVDYTIDANMKSGLYFLGGEGGLFFVVKNPNPSDVVVVIPTNTINAYSCAGGRSMYTCNINGSHAKVPKVSFLRPIRDTSREYADTLGQVLPAVKWLDDEQTQHTNLTYITDLELDELNYYQDSSLLMILGHNEYWSHIAQDNFDTYTQLMGKNAWIGGGNVMWWASRYEDNNNTLVTFKSNDTEAQTPQERTILFLSLGVQLVNSMGGSFHYGGYDINRWEGERESNPFRITQPNSPLFAGTQMTTCQHLDMGNNIEWDGPRVSGFDVNGLPVGDTKSMGVYRHEILAYGWGFRGGHTMGTMHVHQNVPESGYVVQFGSIGATWQAFTKSDGQLYRQIMNNTLDILTTGKDPFSAHADEEREVVYEFETPMNLDPAPSIYEQCAR